MKTSALENVVFKAVSDEILHGGKSFDRFVQSFAMGVLKQSNAFYRLMYLQPNNIIESLKMQLKTLQGEAKFRDAAA